jgi:hypothetical protein
MKARAGPGLPGSVSFTCSDSEISVWTPIQYRRRFQSESLPGQHGVALRQLRAPGRGATAPVRHLT